MLRNNIEKKEEKQTKKPQESKLNNKLELIGFALFIVLVVIIIYFIPSHGKYSEPSGTVTETTFDEWEDVPYQVVDHSYFADEEMEAWFLENRQTAGEYVYQTDEGVYILLSLGTVESENTFLLLNGAKKDNKGELVIGYDQMTLEVSNEIEMEDDIRSTIVYVEGDYSEVKSVQVEES